MVFEVVEMIFELVYSKRYRKYFERVQSFHPSKKISIILFGYFLADPLHPEKFEHFQ